MQLDRRSALKSAFATKRPGGGMAAGTIAASSEASSAAHAVACRLGEAPNFALVQVAGWLSEQGGAGQSRLDALIATELGAPPPQRMGIAIRHHDVCMLRTAPNQIWIFSTPTADPTQRLLAAVDAATGCVTPLSQSRTRIFIEGHKAREVLAKGLAVDLHDGVFALDMFALTGLHHVPVLVHRTAESRYELTVLRTYALTIWEWLVDAAREFEPQIVDAATR